MKIGLDGQKLLIKDLAGPEIYTLNTYKTLAMLDKDNEYMVFFTHEPPVGLWEEIKCSNPRFKYKIVKKIFSWTQISLPIKLFQEPVDIFFSPTHTIPFLHPKKTKIVSMIHGLEHKINKQYYKNPLKKFLHPALILGIVKISKKVVVPSKATLNNILKCYTKLVNPNKFVVIPEAVGKDFYKRKQEEISDICKKYNLLPNKYFIFVSTIQPRKNIERMVQAFSRFIHENEKYNDIVLAMSGKLGWLYEDSLNSPKKYDIEHNVLYLGRTPNEDLPALLSGAKYFINCSLEEGFGIPLLESMSCGIPAIVSNIPAFKEIGKNFPIYIDPYNVEDIKKGIIKRYETACNSKELIEESRKYSWENSTQKLLNIFKNI